MGTLTPGRRALIGLLATILIGVVGFFGTRLAQGAFTDDYRIFVTVGETGQGIIAGSDVVARGVIVGRVGTVELNDELQAVIELILENRYTVPRDAVFAVTGKTLLGEKQVEILFDGPFGTADAIADGGQVDDPDQVVEVQDVLQDLDRLLGAIDPLDLAIVVNDGMGAFVGQEEVIARSVDQGARATDVFSRSLDDQAPTLHDLSLVAEALGPTGEEFNRLGVAIDLGALDTITANQDRLRTLLEELNRFADQLDLVLELTRPDLDRMIVEGDNVTRVLFAYRPELADMLVGINDYSRILTDVGQNDPGFRGNGAGFQVILEEDPFHEVCAGLPAELTGLLPGCAGHADEGGETPPPQPLPSQSPEPPLPVPAPTPDPPLPLLELPGGIQAAPEAPTGGLDVLLEGLLTSGALPSGALPSGALPSGALPSGALPSGALPGPAAPEDSSDTGGLLGGGR